MNKTDREHDWKKYRKKGTTEMREVTVDEICIEGELPDNVSISEADRKAGSPKAGDMIARNPEDHDDQWLVSAEYHAENYEKVGPTPPTESVEDRKDLEKLAEGYIEKIGEGMFPGWPEEECRLAFMDGYSRAMHAARPAPESEGLPRAVVSHYWSGDHTPYRFVLRDSETDAPTDVGKNLEEAFKKLAIEDGDEVEITVRKTGNRPFGDRKVRLAAPHIYERESIQGGSDE